MDKKRLVNISVKVQQQGHSDTYLNYGQRKKKKTLLLEQNNVIQTIRQLLKTFQYFHIV